MKFLVSICNQDPAQSELPGVVLFELDTEGLGHRPIPLENPRLPRPVGITGLADDGAHLWAVIQGTPSRLARINRQYQVQDVWPLELVKDGHSVAVRDGKAYIASTGTDAIIEFDPHHGERVCWKDNDHGQDTIHLNSLFWNQGSLYATAFGKKKGEVWRSADEGYLMNVTSGAVVATALYHPHSACAVQGGDAAGIYFCESQRMAVGRADGQRLRVGSAYTRGLLVTCTHVLVGFSKARAQSRSSTVGPCGWMGGKCGVQIYRRTNGSLSGSQPAGTISLEAYGQEIYDLLPLESASGV